MFLAGAKNLESKKEWINELNVFPVPDGDTGTNMTLTIMSAAKEVAGMENITMETFAKAVSSGSLRGARGNSGVILSQLLRGFTKVIKTETEINAATLAAAFQKAVETAYKAVMKPKEGTILIVPDFENFQVKLILADGGSKLSTSFPILEGEENRKYFARAGVSIEDETPITFEAEQPLLALMYSENDLQVRAVQEFAAGSVSPVNDYAYYISLEFCKAEQ